jgi:hypothetical protein
VFQLLSILRCVSALTNIAFPNTHFVAQAFDFLLAGKHKAAILNRRNRPLELQRVKSHHQGRVRDSFPRFDHRLLCATIFYLYSAHSFLDAHSLSETLLNAHTAVRFDASACTLHLLLERQLVAKTCFSRQSDSFSEREHPCCEINQLHRQSRSKRACQSHRMTKWARTVQTTSHFHLANYPEVQSLKPGWQQILAHATNVSTNSKRSTPKL